MNRLLFLVPFLLLAGCDRLGLPDRAAESAAREAEAKAIGAACRYAGRALEDCYTMNASAAKSAIFAGWREMNDYMTEKRIEVVRPELTPQTPAAAASAPDTAQAADSDRSSPGQTRLNRRRARAAEGEES
ncbi:MAG: hypothetical protein REI09_01715 [Candidatus Dactylopiibacterium sp.]|nr:hypothetical protein [Candidatus Dactylopiibacterium sp.]